MCQLDAAHNKSETQHGFCHALPWTNKSMQVQAWRARVHVPLRGVSTVTDHTTQLGLIGRSNTAEIATSSVVVKTVMLDAATPDTAGCAYAHPYLQNKCPCRNESGTDTSKQLCMALRHSESCDNPICVLASATSPASQHTTSKQHTRAISIPGWQANCSLSLCDTPVKQANNSTKNLHTGQPITST